MTFRIKPEFIELFGPDASYKTVLTEDEIKRLAEDWEKPLEEIMDQVFPNTPQEIKWYYK